MRVAFGLMGGSHWTGGVNYLVNLLTALADLPGRPVESLLFAGPNADGNVLARLQPFLAQRPHLDRLWQPGTLAFRARLASALLLQRDVAAERRFRETGVDVVFQHGAWFGFRFGLPTLGWIADFQHRHLPEMFTRVNWWKRELGYRALARSATTVLLISESARRDCENFYSRARGRTAVLPFAVTVEDRAWRRDPTEVRKRYGLPERFIFLPNQFWQHKNHLRVLAALRLLRDRGQSVCVALSGAPEDRRQPDYPRRVLTAIDELDLRAQCRVLGFVPHEDVLALMRAAVAVLNPSLFEGWSTSVEEAKALGAPILLSDLAVHREQAPPREQCRYFDPREPAAIAQALEGAWNEWLPGPRPERELQARATIAVRRRAYGEHFVTVATTTVARHAARSR